MSISADELPREGLDTQGFIDNMTQMVGSNNTLDVIMRNLPKVARRVGAKMPAYHPDHSELNLIKPMPINRQQNAVSQNDMQQLSNAPNDGDMPDIPKGLHTPKAKMMPGADTAPGQPLNENDAKAFNKMVSEMNVRRTPWDALPSQFDSFNRGNPATPQNKTNSEPIFFKDGLGNEYKTVGDKLYVLGWQDANVKVRLVNTNTGKEIPTNGRKFQIYGWHLVQKITKNSATDADDISQIEKETMTEPDVKKETVKNGDCAAKRVVQIDNTEEIKSTDSAETAVETAERESDAAKAVGADGDSQKNDNTADSECKTEHVSTKSVDEKNSKARNAVVAKKRLI